MDIISTAVCRIVIECDRQVRDFYEVIVRLRHVCMERPSNQSKGIWTTVDCNDKIHWASGLKGTLTEGCGA